MLTYERLPVSESGEPGLLLGSNSPPLGPESLVLKLSVSAPLLALLAVRVPVVVAEQQTPHLAAQGRVHALNATEHEACHTEVSLLYYILSILYISIGMSILHINIL